MREREPDITAGGLVYIPIRSYLIAFFIAGAVIFPILNPHYATRVLFSLGIYGVLCGIDSVIPFGQVTTCAFLSGTCREHSVRWIALLLWAGLGARQFLKPTRES